MIILTDLQQQLLQVVRQRTRGNEMTGAKIANAIGLRERDSGKQGADLRSIVNALRTKGYPILANTNGYYYARNKEELYEYIQSLEGRKNKIEQALEGLEDCLTDFKGAETVEEIAPVLEI